MRAAGGCTGSNGCVRGAGDRCRHASAPETRGSARSRRRRGDTSRSGSDGPQMQRPRDAVGSGGERKMSRIALVTGGMGGLGEAICIKLAALGYRVVTTHSPGNAKAAEWLQTMNNMGYGFKGYPCDVSDFESCKACVEQVAAEVGPVDVLVNNAGITRDMTFKKMTKADWDAVVSTNLDSVFNMTKQVMDGMVERRW